MILVYLRTLPTPVKQFSPSQFHDTSPHEDVPNADTPKDVPDAFFSAAEDSVTTGLSNELLLGSEKLARSPSDLHMVDCCFAQQAQLSWLHGDRMVN
jgi:hypothetical protein